MLLHHPMFYTPAPQQSQCPNYLPYPTNIWFVSPSDPYIFHSLHAVCSQLRACDCSFSIRPVENRQNISGGGKLRPPNSSMTHSGLSSEVRSPAGSYSFHDIRLTISGFTIGNRGELTHGHARAVIGVDTGVKFSGRFFIDTFGSIVGVALSDRVIFISRLSFTGLPISGFTIGNRGESTHGHTRPSLVLTSESHSPADVCSHHRLHLYPQFSPSPHDSTSACSLEHPHQREVADTMPLPNCPGKPPEPDAPGKSFPP